MDYEKAYKNALQLAKSYYDKGTNEFLDTIFPELRESEDERIRKFLIELVLNDKECGYTGLYEERKVQFDDVLAYLEKQKINTEGDFGRGYNCGYEACLHSHGAEWFEKQKEQNAEPFSWGHENGGNSEKPKQEQPEVDLEKELDRYLRWEFQQTAGGNFNNYIQVARHFYELGLNARKEE